MNHWSIGKRITLGFSALVAIAVLLGGMAIWRMKAVRVQATALAQENVP